MGWVKDDQGVITLDAFGGPNRTAYTARQPLAGNGGILGIGAKPNSNTITWFVFGSWDARSCFEVVVDGTNVTIRKVVFVSSVTNVTTPAAHSLPANIPYTINIQVTELTINVYFNGSGTAVATYTIPSDDSLREYRAFGFTANVVGAKVLSFETYELVPAIIVRERMLWWVAGGRLYVSLSGSAAREVARGVCREDGTVQLVEYQNKLYVLDGSKIREVNPIDYTVTPWVASPGNLPGYTGTAGTTDLYLLVNHFGRLMGVSQASSSNVFASALNDADDWDTGAETSGRAFTFVTARVNLSGSVIRGLLSANANRLTIGCATSMWQLLGDPSTGQVMLDQRSSTIGITGPTSMTQVDEDYIIFHSPNGLYKMVGATPPTSLTEQVLTAYIQIPPSERALYNVHFARDTTRKGLMICIYKVGGANVHLWYDEMTGQYQGDGRGGFFPFTFPSGKQPTASVYYDGKLIFGCEDGYLRYADDAAVDDDGTAIESFMSLGQINAPGLQNETILRSMYIIMSAQSSTVTLKVWKGQTAEDAYNPATRSLAYSRSTLPSSGPSTMPARAPVLVPEIYSTGGPWTIAAAEFRAEPGQLIQRHSYATITAPPAPETFDGVAGDVTPDPEDTLGDGPGSEGPPDATVTPPVITVPGGSGTPSTGGTVEA
jgi:hypothetical protein